MAAREDVRRALILLRDGMTPAAARWVADGLTRAAQQADAGSRPGYRVEFARFAEVYPDLVPLERWVGKGFGAGGGCPSAGRCNRAPLLRTGLLVVDEGMPEEQKETVRQVLEAVHEAMLYCYTGGLPYNPNLVGTVTACFTIDERGIATNVGDEGSDLPMDWVVRCILDVHEGLEFPRPVTGPTEVTHSIELSPG